MNGIGNGGIRLQRKRQKLEHGFWNAAIPSTCVVPLQQHTGSLLKPLVHEGDTVREGMIIADGTGRLALPIHAPIPGRVQSVGRARLFDGTYSTAILIELAGEFDQLGKQSEARDWTRLDAESLREIVRDAGVIVGDRSPLPAHAYLRRGRLKIPPVLVLDLAETEPYLTGDAELARTYPQEVLEGMRIAARMADTEECRIVAVKSNHRALDSIREHIDRAFRVHVVPDRYPANIEFQVRRMVLSRQYLHDPAALIFTIYPSTAFAIYEAVVLGKPQIDRVIAVGGGAVARPAHVRVRIGTSVADVLAECGALVCDPAKIVIGGPLTGSLVENVAAPVPKGTSAVLALTEEEIRAGTQQPCIGCGACVRSCPVSLNPVLINDLVRGGRTADALAAGMDDCIECGLCAHLCPSRIPLVVGIREGKRTARKTG
jgi:Na+-translocating ferredoxin:NAD+ oxidoreductase subunit C